MARAAKQSSNSRTTTDHDEIRRWAESRGGRPAVVRGTAGTQGQGALRIDFPGQAGEETLEEIGWDRFFSAFDNNRLALTYQDRTAKGRTSRLAQIVSREPRHHR